MQDKFYVDLSRLEEYTSFLKKQLDRMQEAEAYMHKRTRALSGLLEDQVTARLEEELKYMQQSVDRLRGEIAGAVSDTKKMAELYRMYLQRGDILLASILYGPRRSIRRRRSWPSARSWENMWTPCPGCFCS